MFVSRTALHRPRRSRGGSDQAAAGGSHSSRALGGRHFPRAGPPSGRVATREDHACPAVPGPARRWIIRAMNGLLWLKVAHVVSAAIIFGTGLGIAFFTWFGYRSAMRAGALEA